MSRGSTVPPLVMVVGSGGVGKTTLAAALGLASAAAGRNTLVMTFDPSLRLKDALGVGDEAMDAEVPVDIAGDGRLSASLLDARRTFDRVVRRYSPDERSSRRILSNRFYDHLAGTLAGVLEYMAVERLFEVAAENRYDQVILDTPPTRQALDFLEAPSRILGFLDSGALRIALKPWFDDRGRLRPTSRLGFLGRNIESFLDRIVGMDLLRDMAEFFQAFGPLFEGFRKRAEEVQTLLRSPRTSFVLVSEPSGERIPDTLFFARRLEEAGHHLGPLVVNRVHPRTGAVDLLDGGGAGDDPDGPALLGWLGERDHAAIQHLRSLLTDRHPLVDLPLLPNEPTDLESLAQIGFMLREKLSAAGSILV